MLELRGAILLGLQLPPSRSAGAFLIELLRAVFLKLQGAQSKALRVEGSGFPLLSSLGVSYSPCVPPRLVSAVLVLRGIP